MIMHLAAILINNRSFESGMCIKDYYSSDDDRSKVVSEYPILQRCFKALHTFVSIRKDYLEAPRLIHS